MGQYALNSFTDLSVFKTWFISENKKAENYEKKIWNESGSVSMVDGRGVILL